MAIQHENRLARETSPYLLQHAHNPVDWYPWGNEALERARREDKPIFLSIGYSACHWCHVMERESFENESIAALMNRHFVSIKVDREERPDLDDVYMAAVQAMTGSGGWPMSVFLTPELEPFFGGTYFPPEDRHGMPAFGRVLEALADAYATRRDDVVRQAAELTAYLREQLAVGPGQSDVSGERLERAAAVLARSFDGRLGGFGGAPKFPAPMTLEFLLRRWRHTRDEQTLAMVTLTLDAMLNGGIYDQLGGGFARYSTDAHWLVPHFEKMLYDNALLAHCYLEAFRATGLDRYARTATETIDFVLRELATDDGGIASTLDADSEGEEGRFYVWRRHELRSVLAEIGLGERESSAVAAYWGVTPGGNWEGATILHVTRPLPEVAREHGLEPIELERAVRAARSALFDHRARRVRPGRDDKQLAAWNGMFLRALALASLVLERDDYAQATSRLVGFVRRTLIREDGGLWRTARDGRTHTPGFLEDYGNVADGLLGAYASNGRSDHLVRARGLMDRAIELFWDETAGCFFDTSSEHDEAVVRPRSLIDGATPSGNSVAADVLLRLAVLTGEAEYDRRARSVLRTVATAFDRQPSAFGRMLCVADRSLGEPVDAVIAGDPKAAEAVVMRRAVARPYVPNLVVAPLAAGSRVGDWPLFEGKHAIGGRVTAFVCRGYACDAPTDDPAEAVRQVTALVS
ncbi:MAG: thioredoxin domain-containing protein [Candidatus Limnocylindria bacterium]